MSSKERLVLTILEKNKTINQVKNVLILYSSGPAPTIDGVIKPMKEGGYSDSGADLAFTLLKSEKMVVLSRVISPSPGFLKQIFYQPLSQKC